MTLLIIFCAKYLIYVIALAFAALLAWKFSWDKIIVSAVALVVAYGVAKFAGHLYSHIQPFALKGVAPLIPHMVDNTFPSDHMLIAATLASLAYCYHRGLGLLLWLCAIAVGVARVAALLHYPIDIAVSGVIALVVVAVTYRVGHSYLIQR